MLPDNRNRLTALSAASTKLEIAERLIREADLDIASSGLLPSEDVQKIAADITAYLRRVAFAIELIPSAGPVAIGAECEVQLAATGDCWWRVRYLGIGKESDSYGAFRIERLDARMPAIGTVTCIRQIVPG